MLVVKFGPADLANVRFAISPLLELHQSVRALSEPDARALHLPWITATRAEVAPGDLALLQSLQSEGWYTPDFVHPPPTTPLAELEDELAILLRTPADRVRLEIERVARIGHIPAVLEPFIVDPRAAVRYLADVLRGYWERALAPDWPRLRALLQGDVLYRARQMADGGAQRLFRDIHPELRFSDGALWIEKPFETTLGLDGRGLLLVPSAFRWPKLLAITEPPWQPTLIYPARGVGTLWDPERPAAPTALADALGSRRAAVLTSLDAPRSTTELAVRLGWSAPSVSQHLRVLRDAGFVNAHRVGRVVLYARSQIGDALVDA